MTFEQLGLAESLLRAVRAEGYEIPTPIQLQAIPHVLEGRDILGCAQTGTGKTAAFALPILQRLQQAHGTASRQRHIRALVMAPTRELASQIGESFRTYGKNSGLRGAVIFGGVNQNPQVSAIRAGIDVLVATPGRLLDLMNQGHVDLRSIEVLVLDEADHMLDMGFIHDIRKIVAKVPPVRQSLFFSATMPPEIRTLADSILKDPVAIQVAPVSSTADNVEQSIYHVRKKNKPVLLAHLLKEMNFTRSLVFTRTKHGANKVARDLHRAGITCEAIHGNKSQSARERAIRDFKSYKTHVLVATDIAARGLDIDGVSHVVNFDLPNVPETYVHRIGRTARAGASGVAVSFCDPDERPFLKSIERLTRQTIRVASEQPEYAEIVEASATDSAAEAAPAGRQRRDGRTHGTQRGSKREGAAGQAAVSGERRQGRGDSRRRGGSGQTPPRAVSGQQPGSTREKDSRGGTGEPRRNGRGAPARKKRSYSTVEIESHSFEDERRGGRGSQGNGRRRRGGSGQAAAAQVGRSEGTGGQGGQSGGSNHSARSEQHVRGERSGRSGHQGRSQRGDGGHGRHVSKPSQDGRGHGSVRTNAGGATLSQQGEGSSQSSSQAGQKKRRRGRRRRRTQAQSD